ncbi:hypothetical protein [Paraburkholderia youngii]|uniref:hypothetical protein n=1 Tax=Paraburkholderia youngii TaxID=2782701 RepID=UPI003D1A7134
MNRNTNVVLPFSHARGLAATRKTEAHRLPSFAARPFSRDGLVFGVGTVDGHAGDVAIANVTGLRRLWSPSDRPWGRTSDGATWLAGEVVIALRPDWRESFWSFDFLAAVARDFSETFLINAPVEGGVVNLPEIRAWMDRLKIGRPAWDFSGIARAGRVDVRKVGNLRSV